MQRLKAKLVLIYFVTVNIILLTVRSMLTAFSKLSSRAEETQKQSVLKKIVIASIKFNSEIDEIVNILDNFGQ